MIWECKILKLSRLQRKYQTRAKILQNTFLPSDLDCTPIGLLYLLIITGRRQSSKLRPMDAFKLLSGGGSNNLRPTLVRAPILECDNSPFGRCYRAGAKYIHSKM